MKAYLTQLQRWWKLKTCLHSKAEKRYDIFDQSVYFICNQCGEEINRDI